MAQVRANDWTRHIWKLPIVGAILALISIITPASVIREGGNFIVLWYFGFWFLSVNGTIDSGIARDMFVDEYAQKYMTFGVAAIVLLIIAMILMFISANKGRIEKNYKMATVTSLIGGISAFVAPGSYYFNLKREFSNYWLVYDQGVGFYLPIIAGILAIIGAIAAGYAFSLESKAVLGEVTPYKPALAKPATDTQFDVQSQQERLIFCQKCGTKLVGDFCQECGAKAEF